MEPMYAVPGRGRINITDVNQNGELEWNKILLSTENNYQNALCFTVNLQLSAETGDHTKIEDVSN